MNQHPEFPPYTHIPGKTPHPISDPAGHSFGHDDNEPIHVDETFQWGLQLFTNGYYWEAHEAWEQVWIELGRAGPEADFVKGLIKLAASGVKCLEENSKGAERHYLRSQELMQIAGEIGARRFRGDLSSPIPLLEQIQRMLAQLAAVDRR